MEIVAATKPPGREFVVTGHSRGGLWGGEVLRRLTPPKVDAALLLAPYGNNGEGKAEGEALGWLVSQCHRALVVASKADTSNTWATWGPWTEALQLAAGSNRVIILDDWGHEETRAIALIGQPSPLRGAAADEMLRRAVEVSFPAQAAWAQAWNS